MPRRRQLRCVVAFDTTDAALQMEQCCRANGVSGRLIPLPTQISAGCGLAWSAPPEAEGAVRSELERNAIGHRGVFSLEL